MKKLVVVLLLFIFMGCSLFSQEECYLLFGQSNASWYLEYAIEQKTGVEVIRNWHPGCSVITWYDGSIQENLENDLDVIEGLVNYEVKGIVWFQGESDTASIKQRENFVVNTVQVLMSMLQAVGYPVDIYLIKIGYAGTDQTKMDNCMGIRVRQDVIAGLSELITVGDSWGLERSDPYHLTLAGCVQLVNSMF